MVKTKSPSKAAQYLLCRAAHPIVLEIESVNTKLAATATKYGGWITATTPWPSLESTGHAMSVGAGKWGAEYRIYLPSDKALQRQLERYGYMVESGKVRHKGTMRINNEVLFKELVVEHGLRLGKND
jgi:hypothetical protein